MGGAQLELNLEVRPVVRVRPSLPPPATPAEAPKKERRFGMVRGVWMEIRTCKACGVEEGERVSLHYSKHRCVVACGVLLARKELGTMCHGCGNDEKEPLRFERPEVPGHPWCWPCAAHGAAFWDWSARIHLAWEAGDLEHPHIRYPFDDKHELKGRHKLWPHLRLDTSG